MSEWKQMSGSNNPTWNFDENKEIVGQLIKVKKDVGPNNSMMYVIKVGMDTFDVWGATALDRDMEKVELGDDVKIKFVGMKLNPKTNRKFKNFEVFSKSHEDTDLVEETKEEDLPF